MSPAPSRNTLRFLAPLALLVTLSTALGPKDRRLTNARTGISVEAPAGWTLSQHTGYADTVVLLLHPDGSRISVSAALTTLRDGNELYEQNRAGLMAQGLTVTVAGPAPRGALAVDVAAAGQPEQMRQLYLVREWSQGRQAIVLTLACKTSVVAARLPALDFVVNRMTWDEPLVTSPTATRGRGQGGAGAPSR